MKKLFLLLFLFCTLLFSKEVSVEKMVSSMIIVGFDGNKIGQKWVEQIRRDIKRDKIGGLYISKKNISNEQYIKNLLSYLREDKKDIFFLSKPEFFNKLKDNVSKLSFMEIDKRDRRLYKYLRDIGINMLFWPIVDLESKSAYSRYEEIMSTYALSETQKLKEFKILPVIGYFPGKIFKSTSWDYRELKPYYRLIKSKELEAVILDKSVNKKLDKRNPATFSKFIVANLLKDKLKFDGLIVSADLKNRVFSHFTLKQRVLKAIDAGVDMLFFSSYFSNSSNIPNEVKKIVLQALKDGEVRVDRIKNSYKKIINLRGKYICF